MTTVCTLEASTYSRSAIIFYVITNSFQTRTRAINNWSDKSVDATGLVLIKKVSNVRSKFSTLYHPLCLARIFCSCYTTSYGVCFKMHWSILRRTSCCSMLNRIYTTVLILQPLFNEVYADNFTFVALISSFDGSKSE